LAKQQNFKNHTRLVPVYHGGVLISLLANVVWSGYRISQGVTGDTVMGLVMSVALLMMGLSLRSQILRVQDRLIRLEVRLRMRDHLPADVAARAAHLPVKQLIALRFAGEGEFSQLVKDVLEGIVTEPKEIKKRVTDWQGDHLRA
jgi:hypothetical protein